MKQVIKKFDSLGALSFFIASTPVNGWFEKNGYNSSVDSSEAFTGSESFEAANNLMLQGWSEGAARVQKYMTSGATATAPKRVIYNSVVGFTPNVPNYLSGNPLNMINQRRVKTPKKVVSIVYNCAAGFDIDASNLEKTAAALFNVISGLEASGVRVELWIINPGVNCKIGYKKIGKKRIPYAAKSGSEYFYMAVKIKSAGQPFNLLKMIYPVVHPSFLRRHGFAVQERAGLQGESGGLEWHGYGSIITSKNESKTACAALRIPSDNVFSYYDLTGKTEAEISKMIK